MIKMVIFDWGHTIMDEEKDINIPWEARPSHLMPGVKQTLQRITLPMGIWANTKVATEFDVRKWLEKAEIDNYFTCIVTSTAVGYRKPDARFFSNALEICQLNKDEVLFIGNQLNTDIQGANSYGIKNVWLSGQEYRSNDETLNEDHVKPTYSIKSLVELPQLLNRI